MTPEELERSMVFLIRQQAQFDANIQRLEANLQREREERSHDKPRIARVELAVVRLTELAEIQSQRIDRLDRIIERLSENN